MIYIAYLLISAMIGWTVFVGWLVMPDQPAPVVPRPKREPGWVLRQARPDWMARRAQEAVAQATQTVNYIGHRLQLMDDRQREREGWMKLPTGDWVYPTRQKVTLTNSPSGYRTVPRIQVRMPIAA